MNWQIVIGVVALLFSILSFSLFFADAVRKKSAPADVANHVRAMATSIDGAAIGALAKALSDAFSKLGPGAVALVGAILFLLLSGEALQVYHLTTSETPNARDPQTPANRAPRDAAAQTNIANPANMAGATDNRH